MVLVAVISKKKQNLNYGKEVTLEALQKLMCMF